MKARLTKAEAAMNKLSGDGPTLKTMTDDELAEMIGGPGCKAESLTDAMLEALSADD